ncbi:hypothetical protein BH20GEM2_BH20GEM2_11470 [soil metagenome]
MANAPAEIDADLLRRDLFALASDSLRGREAGTIDELRAAAWLAQRAREVGLEPAGEDGSFFQFFDLERVRTSAGSRVSVGDRRLRLWQDVWVTMPIDVSVDAPLIRLTGMADTAGADLHGRAVLVPLAPPDPLPSADVSLRAFRYTFAALRQQSAALRERGAAAVLLVADSIAATQFGFVGHRMQDGQFLLEAPDPPADPAVPVLWLREGVLEPAAAGERFRAELRTDRFTQPSANVVARVPGTDPALAGEYVLFSGHHDHDGVGSPVAGDSIWNGADDNASVSVALLAIGRAFRERPASRSALFVWHGAEEKGLLGSRWFVQHPTVPKYSMVAGLNADRSGRNHPDSAALLGATPPHRNSTALVAAALAANPGFLLDSSWDDPQHPEGWYFRSDHLPYARAGIPAIFFTTLLHPDYHTPRDEAERIDLAKLARMNEWMYRTGWVVANAAERPALDPAFKLER